MVGIASGRLRQPALAPAVVGRPQRNLLKRNKTDMPRLAQITAAVLSTWSFAAATAQAQTSTPAADGDIIVNAPWQAPDGLKQVPIWPEGAPDMADFPDTPESTKTGTNPKRFAGKPVTGVRNVSTPTMTIFPPKGGNSGAAIVVFPGGGFQILAIDLEGTEICDWATANGVTCVLLKYRVPKTDTYGDSDCKCQVTPKVLRALQDAQRTIKLVRAQAKDLGVDPHKIGVIGFSAGGFLVAQTSNIFAPVYTPVDAIDKLSSRPDFAIALYPGHLCFKGPVLNSTIRVTKDTPPTFLTQAWDDPVDDICNSTLYARALDDAGVPAEVHFFAKGGHAFAIREKDHPISMWPALAETWLKEIGVLQP